MARDYPTLLDLIGGTPVVRLQKIGRELKMPTAHDEFTPLQAKHLNDGIEGSELVTFESSSHMQFVEEPERYRDLAAAFLDRVERR